LAVFRDLKTIIKDAEWREIVEEEWEREDGHPDYAYTEKRYDAFQKEKEIYQKRFGDFLDKLPPYEKMIPKEQKEEFTLLFKERLVACPKCGSTRTMTTAYRKEFEAFECLSCRSTWKYIWKKDKSGLYEEPKIKRTYHFQIPLGKAFCLVIMGIVAFAYIPALEWATAQKFSPEILSYLAYAFVLAMPHELLHALAWWYFGYSAIPIPILIPPILGITIGEKPKRKWENFVISLAPILLTITSYLVYKQTGNEQYFLYGMLNLVGMGYDIFSAFIR